MSDRKLESSDHAIMSIPTKSFESPVSLMRDDLLGRWRLAKDVYAIIGATPKDWSCRIGVYGKWGEGKTSLLQFVETQAQADGLISFWVNPSQAESADGLWRIVIDAFIDALDREGVLLEEVRTWRVRMLAENTAPADKLAELNKYAKAIVGFGREAIREWLKPGGEQVRRLRDKLHSKTVLVFIDDLDRTDPKLVPTLLLGLRDLLDLPGFCFLLAFDDEIISQSLMTVNKAWGDGKAFLDKILDFSFTLPKATPDQRLALVEYHIQQLCPWMDLEVVKQNSDLLPQTPRKMKALLRNLMTLDPLMRRHDPAEIQWVDFFFGQLLRLEAPNFLSDFLKSGNDSLVQVGAYMPQRQEQPPFEQRIDSAVKESGVLDEALRARLSKILSVWSERRAFTGTKNFGYYAGFGSTHRELTEREFEAIVQHYSKSLDFDALLSALSQHAAKVDSPEEEVAQEFLKLLVEARAESLEEAADAEIESDTIEHLNRARQYLELIEDVLKHPTSLFFQTPAFNRDVVQSLFSQVFRWIHFNRSVYQDARSKEKEFLLSLARYNFVSGFDWLEFLTWDSTLYDSQQARDAANELNDELLQIVQDRIAAEALDVFKDENGYRQFEGPKATKAGRFCFLESKSPLWQASNWRRFVAVLEQAKDSRAVRLNASELLSCLSWSRPRPGFAGNKEEHETILRLPGVAMALWTASTAQRVHYRFQQRLIEMRSAVLKIGINEDQLPIPAWLTERIDELRGSGPSATLATNTSV